MATAKTDGRGKTAQLEKQLRELKEAQRIKDAELERLRRRAPADQADTFVWVDDLGAQMNEYQKADFMRAHKETLKALFMYAVRDKQIQKRDQFNAVITQAKKKFEDWAFMQTGNHWKIKTLSLHEARIGGKHDDRAAPEKDTLTMSFVHPGFVRSKIGDPRNVTQSLTPKPIDITLDVRIRRYELDI